ncbi:Bug family tripartite tricarboxylate transporter substrate binding protein [Bordetella sp. 02P26C-1]|uniref:Bug family tripartite tricarboxylate transporter substrate binding protein n=1 Tax=Bordetella sp. 02P26C-1 TaxID=2683195 RepID=UPI0013530D70|nr:tripartite tricarboxylate transporter substrate binding protein [Bordetella sp. 02P26C-1]MVW77808.1 tripartite tricarboxylate transporter substrate binding protein [Bordetella sp. 02P26C-1]
MHKPPDEDASSRRTNATRLTRRQWLAGTAGLIAALPLSVAAQGQARSARPLNLVVPFVPGGPVDLAGRVLAEYLGQELGQTVVVVNKGGAGGNIGAEEVARSAPDGSTLLLALDSILTVNPYFYAKGGEQAVPALAPIGLVGELSSVLVVNAKSPIQNAADFLAYGRRNAMTAGSGGNATAGHLYAEQLKRDFGVQLTHVPYKGLSPAVQDLLAGNIDCIVALIPGVLSHIRAGSLRPLGLTAARPQVMLTGVQPLSEQGLTGFVGASWLALMAPRGLPSDVEQRLSSGLSAVLREPRVIERLQAAGIDPFYADATAVRKRIKDESAQWSALMSQMKLSPQS